MGKRILNALTNNIWYKLLALILGFVLWLVVYNLDDPNITKTFTAVITPVHESSITVDKGLYYSIDEGSTVSVAVTGKRSYINNLSDSDIVATADLSTATIETNESGVITGSVKLVFSSERYNSNLKFNSTIPTVHLSLEKSKRIPWTVVARTEGEPAAGYSVGTPTITSPETFWVSGPESVIDSISEVIAVINVEDYMTADFDDSVRPTFLDAEGKAIDTSKLTFDKVTIHVPILATKNISIKVEQPSGTPANGLSVESVTLDFDKVAVKGNVNEVTSILIPSSAINVDGATETFTTTVDINEYLPENVFLVDSSKSIVTITIEIEEEAEKTYTLATSALSVDGLNDKYTIEFADVTYTVEVKGKKKELDVLTTDKLTGSIDVTGMGAGQHTATVKYDLGNAYDISTVTVTFTLKEKTGNNTNNNSNNNSDDDTNNGSNNSNSNGSDVNPSATGAGTRTI